MKDLKAWLGIGLTAAAIVAALLAPWLAPHDPMKADFVQTLKPPGSPGHLLGTDQLGRDYLSRLLYGARLSLLVGLAAAAISGLIGSALGVAAGYFGGRVDAAVSLLVNLRLSMPVVLVALAAAALVGSSLQVVIAVLGLLLWDRFAVVMRASTMRLRAADYVLAAQATGCSTARIVFGEILPNLSDSLVVVATLEMAHAILLEAALSFLGMGVQPPLPSWGLMVAEGKDYLLFDAWLIAIPGAALFALVLSINLLGDGIRDLTAPDGRR